MPHFYSGNDVLFKLHDVNLSDFHQLQDQLDSATNSFLTALERLDPSILADFSFDYTNLTPTGKAADTIPTEQISFNYTKITFSDINPDTGPSLSDLYADITQVLHDQNLEGKVHLNTHAKEPYMTYTLHDVVISSYSTAGADHLLHVDDLLV